MIRIYGLLPEVYNCNPCNAAKQFCVDNNLEYEFVSVADKLGTNGNPMKKLNVMKEMSGLLNESPMVSAARTMPQIFIDGSHAGGSSDFIARMSRETSDVYKVPEGWVIKYPEIAKMAEQQMHTFWPWDEPAVDNDVQDLMINMSEGDKHGLIETLKLFTLYEMRVGSDYWTNRIGKMFQRPEFQQMSTMFAATEFNSHAPFYNRINEVLYLDNEEFYGEWKHQDNLTARMKFIGEAVSDKDDARSIAAFSFIEGGVLYSSFAYIKHFQAQQYGKNLIKNIVRGVDLSVADEHLHSIGGAAIFDILCREVNGTRQRLHKDIMKMAQTVIDHEYAIIDIIFEKGVSGITKEQMKSFVKHRVNVCLEQLGYEDRFDVEDTTIEKWFYSNINAVKMHDFFLGAGSEYSINWQREGFKSVWA